MHLPFDAMLGLRVRATSVSCPPVPEPVVEVACRTESVEAPAPARREEGEDRE